MRLAALLAQYLYQQKRLDLPGLGTFFMEQNSVDEVESSRHSKSVQTEKIHFEQNPSIRESPELVAFISSQTGKIRALASADLDSHLEIIQQFLNIGKPFTFEGIGNLVKIRAGEYQFSPGPLIAEFKKEPLIKESSVSAEETPEDYNYKNIFYPKQVKAAWKKPLAVFLLVAGLGLAIWGGYVVYKRTGAKKELAAKENEKENINQDNGVDLNNTRKDSADIKLSGETTVEQSRTVPTPPGTYKFILESANAQRAISRFNKLKEYQWNVQLETNDSVNYRIVMFLPLNAADTNRVLDSLSMLTGKKVYIE